MGHIHLATLPRTRKWRAVVDLIGGGALPDDVVSASAIAAERDLFRAAEDPLVIEAVRLLLLVPHAARSQDFGAALRQLDLDIRSSPDLLELLTGVGQHLDAMADGLRARNDHGELAARTLVATLSDKIGQGLPGLFATEPEDVRLAARQLSSRGGLSDLVRGWFGDLVSAELSSSLDRVLSDQIGQSATIRNTADRNAFDVALGQYTQEATRIIAEFVPGWFGKRMSESGTITPDAAKTFTYVCIKKITSELQRKRGADG